MAQKSSVLKKRNDKEFTLADSLEHIKSKYSDISKKEKELVQKEISQIKHKSILTDYKEEYDKERNLLKDEIASKKLLVESLRKQFSDQLVNLARVELDIKKESQHVKKIIDADMHALYEKEKELKELAEKLKIEREDVTDDLQDIENFRRERETMQIREKSLGAEAARLEKLQMNILKKKEEEKEIKPVLKPILVPKKIVIPKKVNVPKQKPPKIIVDTQSLINRTKTLLEHDSLDEAKRNLKLIEVQIKKEKDSHKKKILDYELRDLKTSLKLALLR